MYKRQVLVKPAKYIDYEDLEASRAELEELENFSGPKKKWYERDPLAKREKADYKRCLLYTSRCV